MPTRRDLLKTTAAIPGSLILPKSVFATSATTFHFLHADSCKHWPVSDPVQWSLHNAHEPIPARAADGPSKLTMNDADRGIRLVILRYSLNLIKVLPERELVDHWVSNRADLKPFCKVHRLAQPEIEAVLQNRKNKTATTLTGESFLYGVQLASKFDSDLF